MPWIKKGRIFVPPDGHPWMASHAALPVAVAEGAHHRVYFSARDARGRAHIGWFTLDLDAPGRVLALGDEPVLAPGELGTFDDSGVTGSCLVAHGGRRYLYYSGWSLGVTVPFYFYVGLAADTAGDGRFERVSRGPILDRDAVDPFLTASPWILVENGVWRMWYVSGTGWTAAGSERRHAYHIRYAESEDGRRWRREGRVCIDYTLPDEYAFGRPCVIHDGDRYRMWYCHRGASYRIGYAESTDGLTWTRRDDLAGIDVSPSGWDSEMLCYPHVFDHAGRRYMLYNGNDYGRTGIGLAVWQDP